MEAVPTGKWAATVTGFRMNTRLFTRMIELNQAFVDKSDAVFGTIHHKHISDK